MISILEFIGSAVILIAASTLITLGAKWLIDRS